MLPIAALARKSATPPPGTMPSSTAAFVACIASSTLSFFSLTSTSVEPPTTLGGMTFGHRLIPRPL
jgi:hypothetical protein